MAVPGHLPSRPGAAPAGTSTSPSREASPDLSHLSTEQQVEARRELANVRIAKRNDPSIVDILAASNYSVIYHYDSETEQWVKQKQEGSLFVVHRDNDPEYALFLLNRQTIKNIVIPLVPGNIKASELTGGMLQIARRGDPLKIGIWFTDGSLGTSRFRKAIVRACGEPAKASPSVPVPVLASAPASTTETAMSSKPRPTANDELSKLFANLLPSPHAIKASTPSPVPNTNSSISHSYPAQQSQPSSQPPQPSSQPPQPSSQPPQPTAAVFPTTPNVPVEPSQPPPSLEPPLKSPMSPPAITSETSYPPGQTVDDLLMSILGVAAPRSAPLFSAPEAPAPVAPASIPAPVVPGPSPPPQVPSVPVLGRVGDSTFAQAATTRPPQTSQTIPTAPHAPIPAPVSRPGSNQMNNATPHPGPAQMHARPGSASMHVPPRPGSAHMHASPFPPFPPHFNEQQNFAPPNQAMYPGSGVRLGGPNPNPGPGYPLPSSFPPSMSHPDQAIIRDAVVDGLLGNGGRGINPAVHGPEGRHALAETVMRLIHTDQEFMDHVWRAYMMRRGGGR